MKTSFWRNWLFFGESVGDSREKLFALLVLVFGISGCAHTATKPDRRGWRAADIHKVVVVCVQRDSKVNRRIESNMVPELKHQGFDAIAAQDLFSAASRYSPKDLMGQLQQAQVDGIMEITYSGDVPMDGESRQIKFKYHSIKGQPANLSDRRRPLDAALIALVGI